MKPILIVICALISINASAFCLNQKTENNDLLSRLLEIHCPTDVRELKNLLKDDGMLFESAMVANRGHHNPDLGSFSLFESVSGLSHVLGKDVLPEHFYFGHFTDVKLGEVILDQESLPGKLLIEVMAYDFKKKLYNFYELVGSKSGPVWFYRGDSQDILLDNKKLKIDSPPSFGSRLRCSGCHSSGGPIMKELAFPHNDWWTKERELPFGKNKPSPEIKAYLSTFINASQFSTNVKKGMTLLQNGGLKYPTIKEKLRPLFCSTEINLYSDPVALSSLDSFINVPSVLFVDPLLNEEQNLKLQKSFYLATLRKKKSRFPETNLLDADHGFLAPGRSESNVMHVKKLISDKMIDEEFALDVLRIDFKHPLFSSERCGLLKLVPESSNWKEEFKNKLAQAKSPAAEELLKHLSVLNKEEHKKKANQYLQEKRTSLKSQAGADEEIDKLNNLRLSVFQDEISKNAKGQILEPGFRVIFPKMEE